MSANLFMKMLCFVFLWKVIELSKRKYKETESINPTRVYAKKPLVKEIRHYPIRYLIDQKKISFH